MTAPRHPLYVMFGIAILVSIFVLADTLRLPDFSLETGIRYNNRNSMPSQPAKPSSGNITSATDTWPIPEWPTATPAEVGMDEAKLLQAKQYAGSGSGYIIRHGKLVMTWGSATQRYDLKSTTKSIGVTALGLAVKDGKLTPSDLASECQENFGIPPESNADTGWLEDITLRHLATHTAGFGKSGGYTALLFESGTYWAYSDGGPNWLAECLTVEYEQDLNDLMFERIFAPLGIESSDLRWRNNQYRPDTINGIKRREFGSGIHANVDAMARIGYLYLRNGNWQGEQIIPTSFVQAVRTTVPEVVGLPGYNPDVDLNSADHYGLLW
jgi:CubicO group peptidase (beta-lactamase class C family)